MSDDFFSDDVDYDAIDFEKHKRGKNKHGTLSKRWSFFIIEGIIVLVAVVAGGRFLFSDNANVSDVQSTVAAQPTQVEAVSPQTYYERALLEEDNGLDDAAIQSLSFALELDANFAEAYFRRGELYYAQGRYYEAEKDYEAALLHDYDDPLYVNYSLGLARFNRDDYVGAVEAFNDVISVDEDYIDTIYWRGRSYLESSSYEWGIADIKRAIELEYDNPAYAYFYLAKAYEETENYDEAVETYTTALEFSSADCEEYQCWIDYNNRGANHYWSGDYQAAIKDYTTAIQVNPDEYPLALQNRGDAYEQLDEMPLALADWNTMFQLIEGYQVLHELTADRPVLRDKLADDNTQAHIKFEGAIGDTVTITLTIPDTSLLDPILLLRAPNGNPVAYDSSGDTTGANLTDIVLLEDGTYTIVVASDLANSSGDFELSLQK